MSTTAKAPRKPQRNRARVSLGRTPQTEYVKYLLTPTTTISGDTIDCLSAITYQGKRLPNGYFTCDFQNEFGNLVAEGMLILPDPGTPNTKFTLVGWTTPTPFDPTPDEIATIMGGAAVAFGSGDNLTIQDRALCIRSPSGGYLVSGVFPVGE